ncbi:SET and MYND domain-containing protein 4-like [Scylla paramamosain]|uniref:SET and MYND domain-containing protein 4-like n=1 Tax=Scylla paramamosain TaxID=85552 RepID=UPI003082E2F8
MGPDAPVSVRLDEINYPVEYQEGEGQKSLKLKLKKLRAEGNKCYQKKLLDKALELYNQSIVFAPHPEIKIEKCSNGKISTTSNERQEDVVSEGQSTSCCTNKEEGYKALALGYANRSAVLYELGQYEKCICDIDYALLHGYPTILHSKLAERKAKCLIALQRINEAKSLIETSLQALDALALDEEKIKSSRANLQSLSQLDKKFIDIHPNTKYKLLFSFENPSPPKLAKCNPTIPSLSRSVDLAFSSTQGRYLVANKDIKPGDVIAVEDAYSKVVHLDSSLHNHCTECLARCLTPLPCPICSKININNYQQSVTSEIGCGAYGVMSLTNHSCNPAAARFTFGATEVLKAVRFIPAGTEVTDSYGEHYCVQKEESRIASLLQQYYFKCACEPCRHHWPTYCGLQEECMLKCVSCNNSIDLIGGKCPKCNLDYSKTSRSEKFNVVTYNWTEVIVQLKRIKGEFDLAYKGVIAGNNSSENINKLCEFIEFIDRYVQQPCKLYFEAQETLKHCFDRQASSCLVSP